MIYTDLFGRIYNDEDLNKFSLEKIKELNLHVFEKIKEEVK